MFRGSYMSLGPSSIIHHCDRHFLELRRIATHYLQFNKIISNKYELYMASGANHLNAVSDEDKKKPGFALGYLETIKEEEDEKTLDVAVCIKGMKGEASLMAADHKLARSIIEHYEQRGVTRKRMVEIVTDMLGLSEQDSDSFDSFLKRDRINFLCSSLGSSPAEGLTPAQVYLMLYRDFGHLPVGVDRKRAAEFWHPDACAMDVDPRVVGIVKRSAEFLALTVVAEQKGISPPRPPNTPPPPAACRM